MPDLVEMSEGLSENIILYRWAFGGQTETLAELESKFSPGQETHVYLAGKNAYTWDDDIAGFILVGQWQGPPGDISEIVIATMAPLTGGGNLADGITLDIGNASTSTRGVVRMATTAETEAGTMSGLAISPAKLKEQLDPIKNAPTEKVQVLGSKSGTVAIAAASGNIVTLTATGALTITLTAGADSGYGRVLTLIMTNAGAYTVTWPSTVKWADGSAPTLTAAGTDILTFVTTDAGAVWRGMLSGGGFAS